MAKHHHYHPTDLWGSEPEWPPRRKLVHANWKASLGFGKLSADGPLRPTYAENPAISGELRSWLDTAMHDAGVIHWLRKRSTMEQIGYFKTRQMIPPHLRGQANFAGV